MNAWIIEDEPVAAQALQSLVEEVCPEIKITAVLQTIDESVERFRNRPAPDVVFMDIHLADGSSFAIFEEATVACPVIFTTAYDEYALKAFEVNSIDYLLKPINKKDLERAVHKYKNLSARSQDNTEWIDKLLMSLKRDAPSYRTYFLIPEKDKLIPLAVGDIACIFIDAGMVKVLVHGGRIYYLDHTLDEMMQQLNPNLFFRANRQYIISRDAVKDLSHWFGNKLSVNLKVSVSERILINKARVAEFKRWFAR